MARASGEPSGAALRAWAVLLAVVVARAYRALVLTFFAAAIVPLLFGWHSYLVRSGSMSPSLSVGDVVAASPMPPSAAVPIGRVMVFVSPATGRTTVHRVAGVAGRDQFLTAGDANPSLDTSPVPRTALRELARLRIPFIGLPVLWLTTGRIGLLIAWLIGTILAFVIATGGKRPRRPRAGPGNRPAPTGPPPRKTPPPKTPPGRRDRRAGPLTAVMVTVPAIMLSLAATAEAASFTATTRNAGSSWAVTTAPQQPYTKQVLTDHPYFFYQTDDAGGGAATDASGNAHPGTYSGIAGYRQSGALPNNFGYSVALSGSAHIVGGSATLTNPTTFSLELWFKTSSSAGGKLIGFNSTTGVYSALYDRHIYLQSDGRLAYGGWVGGTITVTPNAYNNGSWHHLVLTATPHSGSSRQDFILYVDGAAVASGTTGVSSYSGYWQVGYGPLPQGFNVPTAGFTGSIDNIAVYQTALTAARISAHYSSR